MTLAGFPILDNRQKNALKKNLEKFLERIEDRI